MRSGLSNEKSGGPSCISLCSLDSGRPGSLFGFRMNCLSSVVHSQREVPCMETFTNSFSLSAWSSGGNFYGDPHTVSVQAQLHLRLGPLQAHSSVGCCFGETDVNCNILLLLEAKPWGKGRWAEQSAAHSAFSVLVLVMNRTIASVYRTHGG